MKKINIVVALLLFSMAALAQRQEPVHPQKDKQEFEGYTIRLLPAMGGTYGYDIRKGNQLIVHQSRNPFSLSPMGLSKKEDVYKLAQWQIRQLNEGKQLASTQPLTQGRDVKLPPALEHRLQLQGSRGPLINQPVSKNVAEELKIDTRR